MKKVLKPLSIMLLSLILLFNNIQVGYRVGAATDKVSVEIGQNYGEMGKSVTIPVKLGNLPYSGISAFNFVIEFDNALVLEEIKTGEIIKSASDFSYCIRENKIYILFSDSTGGTNPLKDSGVLCYLKFKTNNYRKNYQIKRLQDNKEIFADNYLNKLSAEFKDGQIITKENLYRVDTKKTWKITFNKELNTSNINNGSIIVTDINGNKINCTFNIINGGKALEIIPPSKGYELYNSYTISIKDNFLSQKGRKISKQHIWDFYIER